MLRASGDESTKQFSGNLAQFFTHLSPSTQGSMIFRKTYTATISTLLPCFGTWTLKTKARTYFYARVDVN